MDNIQLQLIINLLTDIKAKLLYVAANQEVPLSEEERIGGRLVIDDICYGLASSINELKNIQ